jgi:hypothetical protein
MNVLLNTDQSQLETIGDSGKAPANRKTQAAQAPKQDHASAKAVSESSKPLVTEPVLQANVTLRRDGTGQIYYVFSDARTGKEIREFPASEVRKVAQGVDEFLKQEAQRTQHSLDAKA